MHASLPGMPDFAFDVARLAVFTYDCFSHACRACDMRRPSVSERLLREENVARDRRIRRRLTNMGWRVLTIWGHDLERSPALCTRKIAFNVTLDAGLLDADVLRLTHRGHSI